MKMAQPNVAREPSMDEILASIRRIIESNDAQPDFAPGQDEFALDTTSADLDEEAIVADFHDEEERRAVGEKPAPRVEISANAQQQPSTQPVLSLADVAARVRAASERHLQMREPESRDAGPDERDLRAAGDDASPVVTSRMAPRTTLQPPEDELPDTAAPVEPFIAPVAFEASEPADSDLPAVSADAPAALLSPAVGEKVAQSFGALAEAVGAGPRRSFDEIAEEMMRPMLQEWLDDNLPTLVERLVREEIERVARGPRR